MRFFGSWAGSRARPGPLLILPGKGVTTCLVKTEKVPWGKAPGPDAASGRVGRRNRKTTNGTTTGLTIVVCHKTWAAAGARAGGWDAVPDPVDAAAAAGSAGAEGIWGG